MKLSKIASVIMPIVMLSGAVQAEHSGEHENRMQVFKNAEEMDIASLNIEGVNAFLQDIVSSGDPDAPITCGLFRMEKGEPLVYTYSYDEVKIILDGEMTIAEEGAESYRVAAGDVVYFDKGAKITFTSKSSGLGFYCGQREEGKL